MAISGLLGLLGRPGVKKRLRARFPCFLTGLFDWSFLARFDAAGRLLRPLWIARRVLVYYSGQRHFVGPGGVAFLGLKSST